MFLFWKNGFWGRNLNISGYKISTSYISTKQRHIKSYLQSKSAYKMGSIIQFKILRFYRKALKLLTVPIMHFSVIIVNTACAWLAFL